MFLLLFAKCKLGQNSKCKRSRCVRVSVKENLDDGQNYCGYLVDGCFVDNGFSLTHFAQQDWQKQIKYHARPLNPSPPS